MIEWEDILACPECLCRLNYNPPRQVGDVTGIPSLRCRSCGRLYPIRGGIARFDIPPDSRREYAFETARYDRIAAENPKSWGLDETQPDTRNAILKEKIGNVPLYLNIGQGFGGLEATMPERDKVCLDQSLGFLKRVQEKRIPSTWLVKGYGERMPFQSEAFPCVVSDSVFQTVVDQREYLFENARVLARRGRFLLTIAYSWNYPRKPQFFPASDPKLLIRFLHELGIEAKVSYYDLKRSGDSEIHDTFVPAGGDVGYVASAFSVGDFLVVEGVKE